MLFRIVFIRALSLAAFTLFASAVSAAPITYIESIDGDLPDGAPLTTLTLDGGINTVSGTASATDFTTSDFDSFAFTIPAGLQVTSAKVISPEKTGASNAIDWTLSVDNVPVEVVALPTPGAYVFTSAPLSAGTYDLVMNQFGFDSFPVTADYSFIFNVTTAPEPASLSLLALASAALLRRRP
ncbi:MAG TPA: hypothetical protein VHS31_11075 [Tepidisphaeraceae bacterium]|nr:hypothetical protein [Tepidisphaeraceae bacterium]